MPPFSSRLPHALERNRLTLALDELRAAGTPLIDLTATNPTRVGLNYPTDLLAGLSASQSLEYEPTPFGMASARKAVAAEYARRGSEVDPRQIVLTASTSEAYTWLFKLLCNPGERVLVPRPSYPLFEHLARLEGVAHETYGLEWHGRWDIDLESIRRAPADVRALIVVSPNNPTGSCLSPGERDAVMTICRERGWALIADEVFVDYMLEESAAARDLAVGASCLTVSLGGLSKSVGLPQVKLGWMVVGGPTAERERVLSSLEIIADSFLSVSTPVQVALPDLVARGAAVRHAIADRLRTNLSILRSEMTNWKACDVPRVEGGWSAVLRVPSTRPEEDLVLELLTRDHVLVHPGYFFDFPREAFLVISLLVDPPTLREALPLVLRRASS